MTKKLNMQLSEEQTAQYLSIMRKKTEGEVNEDCEPSGAFLHISVCPIFGASLEVEGQDLGEIIFEFVD
ncbi:hypothetical protein FXF61_12275 [Pseudomonas sp. C27(2019)]|uniref:hypothetical protein n=1 Tax=Pseudomonas sp. C27(2019) TaxID=2604941 RepID=UPI001243D998|nr:hypothetical protein [Pseudomonas sp. C27(2019)]MDY0134320.1 hypothetical protein [Atribacterota bacterium]QEY59881.1 hypothetical protein FXF61_12275 [Pseudomonas sp. C27(2019)]